MTTSGRVACTVAAWGAVALVSLVGGAAAPAVVMAGIAAVAVTGWAWGAVVGLASGLILGVARNTLTDAGLVSEGVARLVREGAFLAPAVFGLVGFGVGSVVSLRHQLRLHRLASQRAQLDPLTGLLTRAAFERRLSDLMAPPARGRRARAAPPPSFALLYVDLDRFKLVNDTFGHGSGDAVLARCAAILSEQVRDDDLVARLGGDEFAIALHGVGHLRDAAAVATKIAVALAAPIAVEGRLVSISASIGAAVYPADGADLVALLAHADRAMYSVKSGAVSDFASPEMRAARGRRLQIERALRFALHDNEFEVVYQPQVDLGGRSLVGFEALLRWNSRELGPVTPTEFIPIAEETGVIVPIGHWLLREACFQIKTWQVMGHPDLKVSVNVSPLQVRQADFLDHIVRAVVDARIRPSLLEIEITEGALVNQFDLALETLRRLDELGVLTALDDFGTGYSSGAWLQRLPIGTLKIDRSVVSGLRLSAAGSTGLSVPLIEGMSSLGHHLGKTVVAEGVETEHQATYLRHLGIERAQGYLFAKPMRPHLAESTLRRLLVPAEAHGDRAAAARVPGEGLGKVVAMLHDDPSPAPPRPLG